MNFQTIKERVIDTHPQSFLTAVLENKQDDDSTIIFSQLIEEQFEQNVQYLASDETISLTDIAQWTENEFLVVGQTIDGDYIAGTTTQTFVIPISLYKSDMEIYNLFLTDFFIDYTNKLVSSVLLPKP